MIRGPRPAINRTGGRHPRYILCMRSTTLAFTLASLLLGASCSDPSQTGSSSSSGGTTAGSAGAGATGGGGSAGATGGGGSAGAEQPPVTVSRAMTDDIVQFPQYLAVRKNGSSLIEPDQQARCEMLLPGLVGLPFAGNAQSCVIFNPYIVTVIPDQATRRKVLQQGFEEVRVVIGAEQAGDRRLAVEVFLTFFDDDLARVETYLSDILFASRAAKVPVILDFDVWN